MNSRDRRSPGRKGFRDPESSYSPHPPQTREGPPYPSKQEDFTLLIERHKKTLDLLAE